MSYVKMDSREKKALKKALIRFLPIPVVLVLIASVLIGYAYFDMKKHDILEEQQSRIVSAMIDYRDYVSYMTSIVRAIETDYIELLGNRTGEDAAASLLIENIRQYPIIKKLRILDPDGMEILCVSQANGSAYVVPAEELKDISGSYYYQETTTLGRHQFLFSGLDLAMDNDAVVVDPYTGKVIPVLHICSPVEVNKRRVGYLVVDFLMRVYLDALRTSASCAGCSMLLLDENGYLYNDADERNNFGFRYDAASGESNRTIYSLIPDINLSNGGGFLIQDNKICSYASFANIYDRSKDYFLSANATEKLIFLICYNDQSAYKNDLHYSFFYHLLVSWKTQLMGIAGIILLYVLILYLTFLYDRVRFTDLFSDNRYAKATLKQALHRHEFINFYQPIIDITNGKVLGVEALSRWNYQGHILPPSMFMDEIMHYRLGQTLDENAFLLVRKDRQRMKEYEGLRDIFISINCCQQTFNNLIKIPPASVICLTDEEKQYIVLELVESIIFNQSIQNRILEMHRQKILFAIDDFGTGNSNIAFIRSIDNLKVKIDRAFVPVDTTNQKERIIIEAFVKMFVDQNPKLIVEGVETKAQYQYLKTLGIQGVQGFYFSHPMTIDQLIEFIEKREYLDKL